MMETTLRLLMFLQLTILSLSLNQEGIELLRLTKILSYGDSPLSTWSEKDANPCSWTGVSCDSEGSVTAVNLSNANLAGPFPSAVLCRLSSLSVISFSNNSINSTLSDDVSTCKALVHLDLSQNYLTGVIPAGLADLSNLKHLDLSGNNFSGDIPSELGRLQKLEMLSLVNNLMDGIIPGFLGNISSLKQLHLAYNPFSPGQIPSELGHLKNLKKLWLTQCNLIGEIPASLGGLANLNDLDLAMNNLVGGIPESFTGLTSVNQIELYNNSLTGELPGWLGKLRNLRKFDASSNKLTGPIPDDFARLPLESLNLYENQLQGSIPASIASSPNLYELRLFQNYLSGELPRNLGANSPLEYIDVSDNQFSGEIPPGLCKKGHLSSVLLINNSFSGTIPSSLAQCVSLTRVRMSLNHLSGEVPDAFWGLPRVSFLDLAGNSLTGPIARTIVGAGDLTSLSLDWNLFNGSIPEELGGLVNLGRLSASNNRLSGSLPFSLMNLSQLGSLDLHGNLLSGELPLAIDGWKSLNELNLANNRFSGHIPDSIGNISVLNYLDLSNNLFTGRVPRSLENLKLNQFNFSNNQLSGPIPPLYAKAMYKSSFLGNHELCGELKGLCDNREKGKGSFYLWLLRIIFLVAAAVLVVGVIWFFIRFRNFKKTRRLDRSRWTLMSFHKVGFNEEEILDGLVEDNVIGSGSSGKVYKVMLSNGETVAVKKFWSAGKEKMESNALHDGDGEFGAEVTTLGKIRHKNIVKLWCCCSNRDSKMLVYEYMQNGSLGDLLRSSKGGLLEWPTRLKILIDAAEGLSYLHHDCVPPIVHRDVKSNNILLDGDFQAKVADFGVAKMVDSAGKAESMSVIAGSCGYIAPEYAYTLRVNEKSDIYSFGVVILEMVTGRGAVDAEYGEKDLAKWVWSKVERNGEDEVVDPKLSSSFKEEIIEVLNVGRLCTSNFPMNRPSMRTVVKLLKEIWAKNHLNEQPSKEDNRDDSNFYDSESYA